MALLLGVTLIASSLAGCGSKTTEAEKPAAEKETAEAGEEEAPSGEKKSIHWISQGPGQGNWEEIMTPILEKFEEETGIHVNAEFYAFNDLFDVIETKAAAGSSDYDVMSVDVTYVAKYGSSGYLEQLDQYFSDEEKAKWDDASRAAGIWEDTTYAVPQNTSAQILFYNKKLLDEAGIEVPENSPEKRLTYEQVAAMAKEGLEKLDPDKSKGLLGFDFQQVSRVYQMNMLANAIGGKNIGDDGFTVDGIINTEPWEKAMTWYQNTVNDGVASRGYDADRVTEQFYSGKMFFMIGGTWTATRMIVDDEIGYAYAPAFEGHEDTVATSTGSWYYGMNPKSENKDETAEFIKYMTLGNGSDQWLATRGDMPSRLEKLEEIEKNPEASEAMKIGAYEAENTAVPRAVTPIYGEYSTILDQTWEDVRNGADVKEALNSAVEQIDSAIAAYK